MHKIHSLLNHLTSEVNPHLVNISPITLTALQRFLTVLNNNEGYI